MNQLTINVGELLFEFETFGEWVNKATVKFERCGYRGSQTICVDAHGRICTLGKQFMLARDEEAFPIKVYAILNAVD